jgi:hypothetical protein
MKGGSEEARKGGRKEGRKEGRRKVPAHQKAGHRPCDMKINEHQYIICI